MGVISIRLRTGERQISPLFTTTEKFSKKEPTYYKRVLDFDRADVQGLLTQFEQFHDWSEDAVSVYLPVTIK